MSESEVRCWDREGFNAPDLSMSEASLAALKEWEMNDTTGLFDSVYVSEKSEGLGKGLFAKKFFHIGDTVVIDQPVVFMQHLYSERLTPACLNCAQPVGTFRHAANKLLENIGKSLENFPEAAQVAQQVCPGKHDPPTIWCDCRKKVFCSDGCRQSQLRYGHHSLLCLNLMSQRMRDAWEAFEKHAKAHHENFILGALAIAQMLVNHTRLPHLHPVSKLKAEFQMFYCPEWEITGGATLEASRRKWIKESAILLRDLFADHITEGNEGLVEPEFYSKVIGVLELCNVNLTFSHPLSRQIRKNAPTLAADSKWMALQKEMRDVFLCRGERRKALPDAERDAMGFSEMSENEEEEEEEESDTESEVADRYRAPSSLSERSPQLSLHPSGEDSTRSSRRPPSSAAIRRAGRVLPPFMGTALMRVIAFTNHSCFPNLDMDFPFSKAQCVLTATRDISPGEELFISYMDQSLPLQERQEHLKRDYGFSCLCMKCRVESAYLLAKRHQHPRTADQIAKKVLGGGEKELGMEEISVVQDVLTEIIADRLQD